MKRGPKRTPLPDRFWPKIDASGDCWLYTGNTDRLGYGKIGLGGKRRHLTGICKNGHTNWVRTSTGTRRCKSCHNESEVKRRAFTRMVTVNGDG